MIGSILSFYKARHSELDSKSIKTDAEFKFGMAVILDSIC